MKQITLVSLYLVIIVLSCNRMSRQNDGEITSFMPGTYIRAFKGDYSTGYDTLIVSRPEAGNNYYIIRHNSSYQKIRDKQLKPLQHASEIWVALADEQNNVLIEQKQGKLISFLPDSGELLLGSSRFHKIK